MTESTRTESSFGRAFAEIFARKTAIPGLSTRAMRDEIALLTEQLHDAIASAHKWKSRAESAPTRESIYACAKSTMIGFQDELSEANIEFICDQISRKATLTT